MVSLDHKTAHRYRWCAFAFLFGLVTTTPVYGQWSIRIGGPHDESVTDLGLDDAGYLYVTGAFAETTNLARLASDGTHQWSKAFDGDFFGQLLAVAADGHFAVAGNFEGPIDFGDGLHNGESFEVYFARFEADGTLIGSRSGAGTGQKQVNGLAFDAAGNLTAVGAFNGTISLGGDVHGSNGGEDLFLAKYDANGTFLWSQTGGGPEDDFPSSLALDANDQPYVAGFFTDTFVIDTETLTGIEDVDVFLAAWDADGALRWAEGYGGPGNDRAGPLAFDAAGNLHLVGTFEGTLDLGHDLLTSAGGRDVFVLRLDDATLQTVDVEDLDVPAPTFSLSASYPNPFVDITRFTLRVPRWQHVCLAVYDLVGRRIAHLHDGLLAPGTQHIFSFDAAALPGGVYVLQAQGETFSATRSIVRLR